MFCEVEVEDSCVAAFSSLALRSLCFVMKNRPSVVTRKRGSLLEETKWCTRSVRAVSRRYVLVHCRVCGRCAAGVRGGESVMAPAYPAYLVVWMPDFVLRR